MIPTRTSAVSRWLAAASTGTLVLLLLAMSLPLAGCGGKADDDLVLAQVGDRQVTKGYYEEHLAKLKPEELPLGDDDQPVDTSTLAGKQAFLDVIINKELMALKAEDMGYRNDPTIADAIKAMTEYQATQAQYRELFDVPASKITEEELQSYYSNLGQQRLCSYLITDFRDRALEARQEVLAGGSWDEVADKYNDSQKSPQGYQITIPWGRFTDTFEEAVFNLEPGEVSMPIPTVYGFWLVRLDSTEQVAVPPLDEIRDRALDGIRQRKIRLSQQRYLDQWHEKYKVNINEDALLTVYHGLPAGEVLIDPVTRQPTPREQLRPLDVPNESLEEVFYSYDLGDGVTTVTVGEFKQTFDNSSVFQRPKRTDMLGGLRNKMLNGIDKAIIVAEAKERGYFEHPEVKAAVDGKVEEMMVSKLYGEAIPYDKTVTPQQAREFYEDHLEDFAVPEGRSGRLVICATQEDAAAAAALAHGEPTWAKVLDAYGTQKGNIEHGGEIKTQQATDTGPLRDALFALNEVGDISAPFAFQDGWAVVRLDQIEPSRQRPLKEVREEVGRRVQARRQDASLRDLLAQWREDYGVTVYTDRLDKVASWDELTGQQGSPEV
jgi:peptidyl-prolyl cis-trans isomerase C